jgi:formate--tetrahydrofolate ligase
MTDIEIARAAPLRPIEDIAALLGLSPGELLPYGAHLAKITRPAGPPRGKLVLVTAMTPTRMGEGKTTISVGLADGLRLLGANAALCLREPSLGPVFGMKGGAAGGGRAQVAPMEDINLHFTGDIHAVTAANNLLAAAADNMAFQGAAPEGFAVSWRRCLDMNDRALRAGFDITAASEVMAILCLAEGLTELKTRLSRAVVGAAGGKRVTCADLRAQGAMAALLHKAMLPNLVQTLAGTPALIHGGPFANIAHGCNSVAATKLALSLADVVVTEAGFGADLGAEKFIDIKCRAAGLTPGCCVVVATARAIAHHGGPENLGKHLENIKNVFGLPAVVAVNKFTSDTPEELAAVARFCEARGVPCAMCTAWADGAEGARELAQAVSRVLSGPLPSFTLAYPDNIPLAEKVVTLAEQVYGARGVVFAPAAREELDRLDAEGYGSLPVCVAKTQYSLSDDPKLLGRPGGFDITVTRARLCAGAGFVVVYTGEVLTMPGLPKAPAYEHIDISPGGVMTGLF